MPQNYVVIGGGAYQPGSASAKKAQELYTQYLSNQRKAANASPTNAPIFSPPVGGAPSNFPSYPTGGSAGGFMSPGSPSLGGASGMPGAGAFGLVPQVANPLSTMAGAIAGNQANLPNLATLGTGTTKLAAGLGQLPFQLNLPNYTGNLGQATVNTTSDLAGIMNPQQLNRLTQFAAERGGGIGVAPGSPNAVTNLMTALNQGIQETQSRGQRELAQLISETPTGQPFNIAGNQVTGQALDVAQNQANWAKAMPDPTLAAQANMDMLLRAIEAGKIAGFPGYGGGGGGPMPRLTAPGATLSPVSPYYYGAGGSGVGGGGSAGGTGYVQPTAPGETPMSLEEQFYWGTNPDALGGPPVDYSTALGGSPYPVDMTGSQYFGGQDYINFPFLPNI